MKTYKSFMNEVFLLTPNARRTQSASTKKKKSDSDKYGEDPEATRRRIQRKNKEAKVTENNINWTRISDRAKESEQQAAKEKEQKLAKSKEASAQFRSDFLKNNKRVRFSDRKGSGWYSRDTGKEYDS